jgi:signal transduction histidine kinase
MNKKDLSIYKRKYDVSRHHAWAGSVLLALLIATRTFLELSNFKVNDIFVVSIGMILIFYTLISVFLTYRYRSGLTSEQKKVVEVYHHNSSDEIEKKKIDSDLEKERLKLEKKKAKAEIKKAKKLKREEEKQKKKN